MPSVGISLTPGNFLERVAGAYYVGVTGLSNGHFLNPTIRVQTMTGLENKKKTKQK